MTTFNKDMAEKAAMDEINKIEKELLLDFKIVLKVKDLCNKPEDSESLIDSSGKPNGPQTLKQELPSWLSPRMVPPNIKGQPLAPHHLSTTLK